MRERQEMDWKVREEHVEETRGHRETALDGYIKVGLQGFAVKDACIYSD